MQERIISAVAVIGALSIVAGTVWVLARTGGEDDEREALATLSGVYNEVTTLRAGHLTWESGREGAPLRLRDSVRTSADARATVAYRTGLVLNVDPDSLLVITAPRRDETGTEIQEVLVASGGVRGEVSSGLTDAGRRVVEVVRESGEVAARLSSTGTTGDPVRYRVRLTEDDTTEVAILSGEAEVESGDERVGVAAGQAVEVSRPENGRSRVSEAQELPGFPSSISPAVDAQLSLDEHPAEVEIAWRRADGDIEDHRLQVARSFSFEKPVLEKLVPGESFAFEVPSTGTYFWRVASRDSRGREGEFGYVRRFSVLSLPDEPAVVEDDPDEEPEEPEPEPPPSVATEVEFDLAGRVVGQGLTRQTRGRGTFRPIRGQVRLNAQDVLQAERWTTLQLGRNSTLQLEADTRIELSRAGRHAGRRVIAVTLNEGGVVTDLGRNAALGSVLVESTAGDRITVRGEDVGARVRTTQMEDRLRVVAERGEATVWAGGREHTLSRGQALDRLTDGEPLILDLPANPNQNQPSAGAEFRTLDSPPEVVFTWQPVADAASYRVRISSGGRLFFQGISRSNRLVHSALPPGDYQWRVYAVTEDGLESLEPPQRAFTVVQDDRPPDITVLSPDDGTTTGDQSITVAGRTEPDVRVKVNGRDVELDAGGRFEAEVNLTPGVNQIVIEAVNRANAVTFRNVRVRRE